MVVLVVSDPTIAAPISIVVPNAAGYALKHQTYTAGYPLAEVSGLLPLTVVQGGCADRTC